MFYLKGLFLELVNSTYSLATYHFHDEIALKELLHPAGAGMVGSGFLVLYYREQGRVNKNRLNGSKLIQKRAC